MNPSTLVLIALVVALGGFVANLADRFGRRIGKKKMTIHKLRPKHTAQLLTTLSGMLIALIVVGFYFLFSQEARDWAVEGHKIKQQRDSLLKEVQDLQQQKETVAQDKDRLAKEKEVLSKNKSALESKIETLGKEAASNTQRLRDSADRLATLRVQQERLESRRRQLEAAKHNVEVQLGQGKIDLKTARSSLKTINGEYETIKSQYNSTIEEINSIQEKNDQLVRENATLETERKQAIEEKRRAEDATESRLKELDSQIQERQNQLDQLKLSLKLFEGATNYYARAPLVYARGDELARRDVPPLLNANQADQLYESVLVEASKAAETKGARSKGDYPVVTLVPVKNPTTGQDVSAAEQQREVIRRLTNSDSPQVLIIRASFNAFQSDPVIALIEISPNPIVFRAGQTLADVRINGRLDEEEIFNQIGTFLRGELSERVRRAGMIPRGSQENSVGEVPTLDLLKLVEEIKSRNSSVNVYALADDVTRASGPLKIRFRVR